MAYSSKCVDCVMGRKEGYGACPVHYDAKEDNARSLRQTGKTIEGMTDTRHRANMQMRDTRHPEAVKAEKQGKGKALPNGGWKGKNSGGGKSTSRQLTSGRD